MNGKDEIQAMVNGRLSKWSEKNGNLSTHLDEKQLLETVNGSSSSVEFTKRKGQNEPVKEDTTVETASTKMATMNIPDGKAIAYIDPETGLSKDHFDEELSKEEIEVHKLIKLDTIPNAKDRKEFVDYVIADKFQDVLMEVVNRVTEFKITKFITPKEFRLVDLTGKVIIDANGKNVTLTIR